jgi:hypothetical protein
VALGWAYLWPALSVAGASLALPWPRFHIPLIELDVRISRIQLSDRTLHSLRSRKAKPPGRPGGLPPRAPTDPCLRN